MTRPLIANKETKSDEAGWSRRIKERDRYLCQFERKSGKKWVLCLRSGTDGAHIYRRWQCGKAKFDDAVGLCACRECHSLFDLYCPEIRVPIARLRAAYDAIASVSKVLTLGDRP